MTSAIAILTYQRQDVLKKTLDTLVKTIPAMVPVAIFDDFSLRDNTVEWLRSQPDLTEGGNRELCDTIEADSFTIMYEGRRVEVFSGRQNLGVAANSNRALKWFETSTIGYDHLLLANDDLIFNGNVVAAYAQAHTDLEIGLFCFNNLKDDQHRWMTTSYRGYKLKVFQMMTGAAMSMTKGLINTIGYFDPAFGKFGEEHCDYTNRARIRGFMKVTGVNQVCIDVDFKPQVLDHQHDAASSVTPMEKEACDAIATQTMRDKLNSYGQGQVYVPFKLRHIRFVSGHAGFGAGIRPQNMPGYTEARFIPPSPVDE